MPYKFEIKEQVAQPTLFVRSTCAVQNLPMFFGKTYGDIVQYLASLEEQPTGAAYCIYYNMDMQALDIQAGFPVAHTIPGKGDIQSGEIPSGRYASGLNIGPYDKMEPFYNALIQWVKAQGEEVTGVAFEWYFSPPETPPQDVKIEVWFPLK
ncbi:MAG: GyrI-like domain-containing protein [Anaerolineales bacterium]|nr:GyrI-like domain-containing protein [Anaerolineales bacterium]